MIFLPMVPFKCWYFDHNCFKNLLKFSSEFNLLPDMQPKICSQRWVVNPPPARIFLEASSMMVHTLIPFVSSAVNIYQKREKYIDVG